MNQIILRLVVLATLGYSNSAAALNLFACEPEWASLSKELGGNLNTIDVALNVNQDPHRLQAKPSLIAAIRNTDLLICSGADLEVGWLPLLLRRSNNARIQPGQDGYFEASSFVRRLEVPTRIDRSQGDVHPQGNPHVHLDPRNIRIIAKALTQRLISLDPANTAEYERLGADFQDRWQVAMATWRDQAKSLQGTRVITHHTSFAYLENFLGLERLATLEAKPGIPPSSSHLASLLKLVAAQPPRYLLRAPYEDPKPAAWLSARTDLPIHVLPYSVGGGSVAENLFDLFDISLSRLAEQQ